MAWAQLLRDTSAPAGIIVGLLDSASGPLDSAARHLASGRPRLTVIDALDCGGPDATAMLSVAAARRLR